MSSSADSLTDGIQLLRLAEKHQHSSLLTPPPSDDSQKSLKSTSNHSDQEMSKNLHDVEAYIDALKGEKHQLAQYSSGGFNHVFNLIDKEIQKVGGNDAHDGGSQMSGDGSMLTETIMVPVEKFPDYNFVGRLLGPRGTTAKQLEVTTGCRITILGRTKRDGSSSNPDVTTGPLRVQISVPADMPQAAKLLKGGVGHIQAILDVPTDGNDELKRQQLLILANMNGTYQPRGSATSPGSGDYGHPFQNLLPYGYRLPGNSPSHHESKNDCYNPKCAMMRSFIEHSNNNHSSMQKMDDVFHMMHMYELMNRVRIANSHLFGRPEDISKAQEIGNRMCSSINAPRARSSNSTTTTTTTLPPRRFFNTKPRPSYQANNESNNANK
ncbi:K Homology domain-containing protein [Caenorhabditis elegans]|uniref:K Homology domain-containing protein n=1 Tax=Caenorhabditis elegans TaxID=6239 RepID=Q8I4C4_CAEEL|nr:K Homology domain-containing protein [Caenorhabditis elegans]CAD56258.1 K Homology domain-containing protein [Caenorhabditis elegans]|eukprot:NP_872088.1 Uncharacterized protein CELE_Y57G11C.36 [Caenorhabditis elegans]